LITSKRVSGPRLDKRPIRILRLKLRGVIADDDDEEDEEELEEEGDEEEEELEMEDKLSCLGLLLLLLFDDTEGESLFWIINTFPEVDSEDFPSGVEELLLLLLLLLWLWFELLFDDDDDDGEKPNVGETIVESHSLNFSLNRISSAPSGHRTIRRKLGLSAPSDDITFALSIA
jgi:hypothetical protein